MEENAGPSSSFCEELKTLSYHHLVLYRNNVITKQGYHTQVPQVWVPNKEGDAKKAGSPIFLYFNYWGEKTLSGNQKFLKSGRFYKICNISPGFFAVGAGTS